MKLNFDIFKKSALLILLLVIFSGSTSFAEINIKRISGNDRYETSANVSSENFTSSKYAIIASGEKYPDAIMSGAISTQVTAPILLVGKDYIPPEVIKELKRLNCQTIFLIGGNNTISTDTIYNIYKQTGIYPRRIAGKDRFETANRINDLRLELNGTTYDDLDGITWHYYGAVSGYNFYDALYAAPYVGLAKFDTKWLLQLEFCNNTFDFDNSDVDSGFIIGDVDVINRNGAYYPSLTRGKNRYETSVKIAESYSIPYSINYNPDTVVITSGEDYPDGLSSAGITAIYTAPILLTPKYHLDNSVKDYLQKNNINTVFIVGGENSVSRDIEKEIRELK